MFYRYSVHCWIILIGASLAACSDNPITGTVPTNELDENQQLGVLSDGIRVMTRNVYVGADVDRILTAGSADDIPVLAAKAFQELHATDFHERAQLIAREIKWTKPHLIGLQEISTIRVQSPGDAIAGGNQPAETVRFDYLSILLDALDAEDLAYRAVAQVQNADVEVPMLTDTEQLAFDDVRLTDYDVILARHDVAVAEVFAQNYAAMLSVPFGEGVTMDVPRGIVAVTATVEGRRYRFLNTHLEPVSVPELLPLQLAQAQELLALLATEARPVILVGDFNTHAPVGETYQLLSTEGFEDVWLRQSQRATGDLTCCHALDLVNSVAAFDRRIDFVFYRGSGTIQEVLAAVVGDEATNRTRNGMWPSDHAGVVAHLRF